ncbi:MAG: AraC family ligand binding domain-containing protein [Deltaproteobacteria bacterium]|nr:AraC family ligand binding domain-containing protein [Deltaproteobacteria bacterium]
MKKIETKELVAMRPDAKNSFIVFDSDQARLALFCSEPGQGVERCVSNSRVMMTVLEGKGVFLTEGAELEGGPGSVIIWEPGEPHGYRAKTRLVFLATIAPRP